MSSRNDVWGGVRLRDVLPALRVNVRHVAWWLVVVLNFMIVAVVWGAFQALKGERPADVLSSAVGFGLLMTVTSTAMTPWRQAIKEVSAGLDGASDPVVRAAAVGGPLPSDERRRVAAAALVAYRRAATRRGRKHRAGLLVIVLAPVGAVAVILALTGSLLWWVAVVVLAALGVVVEPVGRRSRRRLDPILAFLNEG